MSCLGPSPAARRFYRAFYSWHQYTFAPHDHRVKQIGRIAPKRAISTSTISRQQSVASAEAKETVDNVSFVQSQDESKPITQISDANRGVYSPFVPQSKGASDQDVNTATRAEEEHEIVAVKTPVNTWEQWSTVSEVKLRTVLRTLSHPVAIVTAIADPPDRQFDEDSRIPLKFCRGATISSFSTVSLHPTPMVSFNLKTSSSTWSAIKTKGTFSINLLLANRYGARLADIFSQKHDLPYGAFDLMVTHSAGGVRPVVQNQKLLAPILRKKSAILASLVAKIDAAKCIEINDHVIVVASVEALYNTARLREMLEVHHFEGHGLTYSDGRYRMRGFELEEGASVRRVRSTIARLTSAVAEVAAEGRQDEIGRIESNEGITSSELTTEEINDDPSELSTQVSSIQQQLEVLKQKRRELGGDERSKGVTDGSHIGRNMHRSSGILQGPEVSSQISNSARQFSTFTRRQTSHSLSVRRRRHFPKSPRPKVIMEPSVANLTVGDFFNLDEQGHGQIHRSKALINASNQIKHMQRRLPTAWPKQQERLQQNINVAERNIARKLAWNAALELRVMLDKGRIEYTIAPWLEGCVERGLVVLTEDITRTKQLLSRGAINMETYHQLMEELNQTFDMLRTEAMRLRQASEEDAEGGGSGSGYDGGY